jgi:hypothetical protein
MKKESKDGWEAARRAQVKSISPIQEDSNRDDENSGCSLKVKPTRLVKWVQRTKQNQQ